MLAKQEHLTAMYGNQELVFLCFSLWKLFQWHTQTSKVLKRRQRTKRPVK